MRRFQISLYVLFIIIASGLGITARAQDSQRYVSINGDDSGPCNRSAPCRTFRGALAQTPAGGVIIALDSGAYGPATINKAATIFAPDGIYAVVDGAPDLAGLTINAGGADVVVLRGLTIKSVNGNQGINFIAGGSLRIENCVISGWAASGVNFDVTGQAPGKGPTQLFMKDTTVRGVGGGAGVSIKGDQGSVSATIDHCQLENNGVGLLASAGSRVAIRDSVAAGNTSAGFMADGDAVELNLENCVATINNAGVQAGAGATVRVSNTTITSNARGLASGAGGKLLTYGNNKLAGNEDDGAFDGAVENPNNGGKISSVIAGAGLTGGGSSGDVTLSVAPGGIQPEMIADGSITESKLAEAAVTEKKLAEAAVTEKKLAEAAVTEKKLAEAAVTEKKLAEAAVTEKKLAEAAVTERAIADKAIQERALADQAVQSRALADKAVQERALADKAVQERALADQAVQSRALADKAVQERALADKAVQERALADQAVQARVISDKAIQNRHFADGAVVKRINGLSDNVTITGGSNISITPSGNTLSISAPILIGGSGLAGRLARWTSANALAASGITESGANIGIGTANPIEKLHIDGTGVVRARINSDTNAGVRLALRNQAQWSVASVEATFCATVCVVSRDFQIYSEQAGKNALYISEGSLNISTGGGLTTGGSVTPTNDNAYFLGNQSRRWGAVFATNGAIQTSDARLKQGIKNLGYGLSEVMRLRPVTFKWKEGGDARTHLGLIAQEVEQIIPEAIEKGTTPDAPLGMNYTSLVPVLIKAVQEQQAELTRREAQIDALQRRLAELAARNKAIEQAQR